MNNRERFEYTLNFKEPDRVPIDYLAHPQVSQKLKDHFKIDTEADLLEALGCDFYYLSCRDISQNESCAAVYKGPKLEITKQERICPFGIRWQREVFDAKFAVDVAIRPPLENAQAEQDILKHAWPKADWFDFEPFHAECEKNKERIIVGGFWAGILGDCYRMLGFENFLLNISLKPRMVKTLINRMTDFYLELNAKVFDELKGKIDIWFFGNDFGTQNGLLFSLDMFREFFLPDICRLTALAQSYGINIMMHSCGAIKEIIPLLIDAGVQILDPVQVTASGMDPVQLKKEFGGRIVFHGAIDTQQILPHSSPDEVYNHCQNTIAILSREGGYIFAPSQILSEDIPLENIITMYDTARSFS